MLEPKIIYLDICYKYNQLTEENYATQIHQSKRALYGECNARFSLLKKKEKLVSMDTWKKPEGVANIRSIPKLDKAGYLITYDTEEEYIVQTQKKYQFQAWLWGVQRDDVHRSE